jgi:urea transporter
MTHRHHHLHWFFWPFRALWKLLAGLIGLTGHLVAVVLGAALMLAGGLVSLTVVGAVVGIPLAVLGLMIVLRGLF